MLDMALSNTSAIDIEIGWLLEIYAGTPNPETGVYPSDSDCDREEKRLRSVTTNETILTRKIGEMKYSLDMLYFQRRGLMIDTTIGWCVACGQNKISPVDGEDTCLSCRRGV
jgi:hypothetical protein